MTAKTRINGRNYTQLPRLVTDDVILKGIPQTAGAPDGYGDIANAVNGLIDISYSATTPAGFEWPEDLPQIVAVKSGETYSCKTKPDDLIDFSIFTNTQYVDASRPDSSGDGASWDQAERVIGLAIDNAISSGLPTRILVKSGVYDRSQSICNANSSKVLTAPITIEAVYGEVTTGTFDLLTYTKTAGQDFVYQANRSNVLAAINPSVKSGRASQSLYKKVASIAECNANSGSWYTDGAIFYVHTFTGEPANNGNTLAVLHAIGASLSGNSDIYMAGINCIGGNTGALHIKDGSTNVVVADNCSFKGGVSSASGGTPRDGVEILGCKLFAAFKSYASLNSKDGFNLHIQGEVTPSMLTVNCAGFDNGQIINTSLSNNGITVHDGLKAIDIGGKWLGSVGTNAGHIGDGTQVWHFGTIAGQSDGDTINGGSINYGAFGAWSGAAEIWLENCEDYSSRVGVNATGNGKAYLKNHSGTGMKVGDVVEL